MEEEQQMVSLIPGVEIRQIKPYRDERGSLLKILMRQHLGDGQANFGEIYINTAVPRAVKGNHYHGAISEWFCVLSGQIALALVDTKTGARDKIYLEGDTPKVVCVRPYIAHALKNIGPDQAIFLAYADYPYDPKNPDTLAFEVFS